MARDEELWVTMTWSTICSNSWKIPVASLSPNTPTTAMISSKLNSLSKVSANALAPCGLCAASKITVGSRWTTSQRPGEVTAAKPARTASISRG